MIFIDSKSPLWKYLSEGQRGLLEQGFYLLDDLNQHTNIHITDYSYLVFPFAKAYEGYLKQMFRDLGFISPHDYESDHFRIGKVLNPTLEHSLRKMSVYDKVVRRSGDGALAENLWFTWKRGRNLVFHYFPHNLRALTLEEAKDIIQNILTTMEDAFIKCRIEEAV